MDSLSLDDARALLMGERIRPLTDVEEMESSFDVGEPEGLNEPENLSEVEARVYASLQEAEEAAFDATLDAAFGKPGDEEFVIDADAGTAAGTAAPVAADAAAGVAQAASFDNGMVGLGVDIVEIERMQKILVRNPSFASKVFSVEEQIYCDTQSNTAAHYAVRFAAKEAVVKALGTGFSEGIGVRDIEVERSKNGRPLVKLSGAAARIAEEQGILEISLSMSYTKTDAVACAMAVTQSAVRATEKRKDPMKELAKQFKETRKMLDDL